MSNTNKKENPDDDEEDIFSAWGQPPPLVLREQGADSGRRIIQDSEYTRGSGVLWGGCRQPPLD